MAFDTDGKAQARTIRRYQKSLRRYGRECTLEQAAIMFIKHGLSAKWRQFFGRHQTHDPHKSKCVI